MSSGAGLEDDVIHISTDEEEEDCDSKQKEKRGRVYNAWRNERGRGNRKADPAVWQKLKNPSANLFLPPVNTTTDSSKALYNRRSKGSTLVMKRIFVRREQQEEAAISDDFPQPEVPPAARIVEQNLHVSVTELPLTAASSMAASSASNPVVSVPVGENLLAPARSHAGFIREQAQGRRRLGSGDKNGRGSAAGVWGRLGNPELLLCDAAKLLG